MPTASPPRPVAATRCCSAVVVGAAAVLGFSDNMWGQLLALASGLAMLLRARLFRYTTQVAAVLGAGLASLALLVLGLSLNPPAHAVLKLLTENDRGPLDIRTLWLAAAVTAGAGLLLAIALIIPRVGLSPFWGRLSDLAESAFLLSLVPLCLAALDVYSTVRGLTSG